MRLSHLFGLLFLAGTALAFQTGIPRTHTGQCALYFARNHCSARMGKAHCGVMKGGDLSRIDALKEPAVTRIQPPKARILAVSGRSRYLSWSWPASVLLTVVFLVGWVAPAEAQPPKAGSYYDQIADAMPLKTMRGVWRYKEKRDGKECIGTLTFKGQLDQANRGEILFEPRTSADGSSGGLCYSPIPPQQTVKGKWLMKPSRFEKATIQFNARWKLRAEEGRHIFRGDVTAEPVVGKGSVPNARISGEILRDFANEDYRKVGTFEADLRSLLPDEQPGTSAATPVEVLE